MNARVPDDTLRVETPLPLTHEEITSATAETLLKFAKQFMEATHPLHEFGKRYAVELLCRDQFKRDDAAHQALTQMEPKIREVYGVYI